MSVTKFISLRNVGSALHCHSSFIFHKIYLISSEKVIVTFLLLPSLSFSIFVAASKKIITSIIKMLIFSLLMTVCLILDITEGLARFTKEPPSLLYVSVGKTARFVWDYTVDNREKDFQEFSPTWSFYWPNNSSVIGYELVFYQRNWTINNKTCPKRLLNPIRVSIEHNATLVIQNVTTADSGTYGCSLVLTTRNPITSKTELVVTTRPKIRTTAGNLSVIEIREGDSLNITCSASGIPQPNVTWINKTTSSIISARKGHATLKIKNITVHQSGCYECRATNNPNEVPATMETKIIVLYVTVSPMVSDQNNSKSNKNEGTTVTTKQDATVSPVVDDENGSKSTKEEATITTKHVSIQVTIQRRRKPKSVTLLVGGILGAGLMVAVAIGLTIGIISKKNGMTRKNETNESDNIRSPNVLSNEDELEIPFYAEVDSYSKATDVEPIYAQVDKSKKKRPGQINYAELEDFQPTGKILNELNFPPEYANTEYADLKGISSQGNNKPFYEVP